MTVLNQANDGLLSILIVVCKALRRWGPMDRNKLEELCAPVSVVQDRKKLRFTVNRWTDLGCLVNTERGLGLAELPPARASDAQYVDFLRTHVLDILLRESNVPSLEGADSEEASRATDFARVASWALLQNPYRFAAASFTDLQNMAKEEKAAPAIFSGDNILSGFQEWGYFSGLGVPTSKGFLLTPARALRARLDSFFAKRKEISLDDFLRAAREAIPILNGGRYSKTVASHLGKPWRELADSELSPALSIAIMQLQHEGEIYCSDKEGDQTPHFTLLRGTGGAWKKVSHIRRDAPRLARLAGAK